MPIELGPFTLLRPVARGGMAEVWRAVHRDAGTVVAIKVMTAVPTRERSFRAAFRTEIRAAAALAHPSVVPIYDFGEVTDAAARAANGRLAAGSPYIVMEFAPYGSLSRRRGRLRWRVLRATLAGILQALGHAHARGMVHCDLKPGNLLLYPGDAVKLTDFGLAHLGSDERDATAGGTPTYMAPEQFAHRWRDIGPWTDLYGLGVLAWVLACGSPPFGDGDDVALTMRGHLSQDPGPFRPRVTTPDGFEAWVRRLLAKDPLDRFQRAADAAHVLAAFEDPSTRVPVDAEPLDDRGERALPSRDTVLREPPLHHQDTVIREGSPVSAGADWPPLFASPPPGAAGGPSVPERCAPPLPALDDLAAPPPLPWIPGIGARLFGIRQTPLVGRRAERALLWEALGEVHRTGGARVVVVSGPTGSGKTRLARWLAETADEHGAAIVLRATHSASGAETDGVRGLLARALRCAGLDRDGILGRLRSRVALDPDVRLALAEAIAPDGATPATEPAERDAAVLRWLQLRGRERPLLLWLDQAEYGGETLALVRRVLDAQAYAPLPVLVVVLADADLLARRPVERQAIARLEALPVARALRLGPFPRADLRELVRELLPLEPELARAVEARTHGHPAFLLQLLEDWATRGRLVPRERGWGLADGERPDLPEDLRAFGSERIERWLQGRAEGAGPALELAAALGPEVALADWRAACARAGVLPPDGLLDELVAARFADPWPDRGGFTFAQAALREVLERRAVAGGRWAAAHRACAAMLAGREGADEVGRRARHRAIAGDPGAEADFHLALVRGRARDPRWTVDLVSAWDERLPVADPATLGAAEAERRCEGWVAGVKAARQCGLTDTADRWTAGARVVLDRGGRPDLLARLRIEQAGLAQDLGRPEEARARYDEAARAARAAGDERLQMTAMLSTALLSQELGNLPRARAQLEEVLALARRVGHPLVAARALVSLGSVDLLEGDLARALARIAEGLPALEALATAWDRAQAHNTLAEACRAAGDLARAEEHYRRALELHREIGSWPGVYVELNLHLVGFARGRFATAEPHLQRILAWALQDRRAGVEAAARVCLLRCIAAQERWEEIDPHLDALRARLAETRMVQLDVAVLAQAAGEAAIAAGQTLRARGLLEVALAQYVALGRQADRDRVAERIASLFRRRATASTPGATG